MCPNIYTLTSNKKEEDNNPHTNHDKGRNQKRPSPEMENN